MRSKGEPFVLEIKIICFALPHHRNPIFYANIECRGAPPPLAITNSDIHV